MSSHTSELVKTFRCGHPMDAENTMWQTRNGKRTPQKCRLCDREYQRRAQAERAKQRAADPDFKRRRNEAKARWVARHPERDMAHRKTHLALRNGTLVRPDSCSECGRQVKPEAAHVDYSKPLEVIWLCKRCHMAHDRKYHKGRLDHLEPAPQVEPRPRRPPKVPAHCHICGKLLPGRYVGKRKFTYCCKSHSQMAYMRRKRAALKEQP